jgi:ATP-dependent DNA helicase RecG
MYLRGYIEHVGSGTGDIIDKCRESGLPPPQWESEVDGLTIILRRANIASRPQTDKGAQGVGLDVGLNVGLERTVVDEIRARPKIRMSEIAVKYQVTKRTVERVFSKLTQEGKIARVGGKRFGHWEVVLRNE